MAAGHEEGLRDETASQEEQTVVLLSAGEYRALFVEFLTLRV